MIDQLWLAIALLKDKKEVHDFLHDILTHTEIQMLAKRLQVVIMLEEGLTYEQIKSSLNVSEATISKIQNWKEAFGKGYTMVIERLKVRKRQKSYRLSHMSSRRAAAQLWKFKIL